jgi:hypothetical protein
MNIIIVYFMTTTHLALRYCGSVRSDSRPRTTGHGHGHGQGWAWPVPMWNLHGMATNSVNADSVPSVPNQTHATSHFSRSKPIPCYSSFQPTQHTYSSRARVIAARRFVKNNRVVLLRDLICPWEGAGFWEIRHYGDEISLVDWSTCGPASMQ